MNIYISDKTKKDECINFIKYWEEKWFPQITKKLYDYCKEIDGEIVHETICGKVELSEKSKLEETL